MRVDTVDLNTNERTPSKEGQQFSVAHDVVVQCWVAEDPEERVLNTRKEWIGKLEQLYFYFFLTLYIRHYTFVTSVNLCNCVTLCMYECLSVSLCWTTFSQSELSTTDQAKPTNRIYPNQPSTFRSSLRTWIKEREKRLINDDRKKGNKLNDPAWQWGHATLRPPRILGRNWRIRNVSKHMWYQEDNW